MRSPRKNPQHIRNHRKTKELASDHPTVKLSGITKDDQTFGVTLQLASRVVVLPKLLIDCSVAP